MTSDKYEDRLLALEEKMRELVMVKDKEGEMILNRRAGLGDRRTEKAREFRQWMWTGSAIGTGVSCRRGSYDEENK